RHVVFAFYSLIVAATLPAGKGFFCRPSRRPSGQRERILGATLRVVNEALARCLWVAEEACANRGNHAPVENLWRLARNLRSAKPGAAGVQGPFRPSRATGQASRSTTTWMLAITSWWSFALTWYSPISLMGSASWILRF